MRFIAPSVYAALIAGAPVVAAPAIKNPAPADPPPVVGEWLAERFVVDVQTVDFFPGSLRYTFTADGTWVEVFAGKRKEGEYKTKAKAALSEIDLLRPPAGPTDTGFGPGIFKIDGDTLTICIPVDPGDRPASFDASANVLMTFKRVKKKD
jgi:uncharacterized protein (TIGR03067 family)